LTRATAARLRAAAAFALVGGAAVSGASPGPDPNGIPLPGRDDSWVQVRTANFTLSGDASVSKIKEAGLDLERLRAVLLRMKKSLTANSPVPTSLLVFKNRAALEPYLPRESGKPKNIDGYFQTSSDGNFIAFTAAWNADPRPMVYHEYLHYFLHANFPPQPLWYDEGLAEFYSTFRSTENEARTGIVIDDHVRFLLGTKLMPLDQLFAVNHDSPEYNEQSKQGLFYAESWALVHYLMRGKPERAPQLGRYLLLIQNGRPRDEAFREAFQMDTSALLAELAAYLRSSRFFYNRLTFAELTVPDVVHVEPMPWEDVVARLGDFLAHGGDDRLPDAERFLNATLSARPGHAGALASLIWIRVRQRDYDTAADLVARASASGSKDFRVYYYGGLSRMHQLFRTAQHAGHLDAKSRALLEEARSDLHRSVELNDDFPEAKALLGQTYLAEVGPAAAEGVPFLEEAVARLPSREDLARDLKTLRGRAAVDPALLTAEGVRPTPRAERLARNAALDEVHELLRKGRTEEAVAELEELARVTPEEDRALVDDELAAARLKESWRRSRKDYDEGMALLKKGDRRGALAHFRAVLAAPEVPPNLAKLARERITELEKAHPPATPGAR
jgi:tetratricopeptide (TPR) repeat protein